MSGKPDTNPEMKPASNYETTKMATGQDEQLELKAVVEFLMSVAPNAEIRGNGASSFLFAQANNRALELSSTADGVWVEYWQGDIEMPDHDCLFPTHYAAMLDAKEWLTHNTVLDRLLPCFNCENAFTLRDLLNSAKASWPKQKWIALVCPSCSQNIYLQLHCTTLSVGELSGFPGPTFVPKCVVDISTMSFSTENDGVHLYYQSLSWFVPAN